jgi:steroid delta-isomerase-like uncharacterized protein
MALISTEKEMREYEERFVEEVWNDKDYSLIDETVADDYVGHWFGIEEKAVGPEGLKSFVGAIHEGFSDFRMETEFTVAEDDMIVVGFRTTGTHDGEYKGIPATNRTGETPGIYAHRFEDGEVVEAWAAWDALGLMQQLEVVPETFTLTEFLESATELAKSGIRKRA